MRLKLLLAIALFFLPSCAFLDLKPETNDVRFSITYGLHVPGNTSKIKLICLIPKTIENRQTIFDINYSVPPSRIYDADGNRYAEFIFTNPDKDIKIQIRVKAQLIRYDLVTAYAVHKKHEEDVSQKYLASEKYLEKDNPAIMEVCKKIITGPSEIATVGNIHDYVLDKMEYAGYQDQSLGAAQALKLGKGDCSEYVDLFVTLCRAKNIPARIAEGYCTKSAESYGHVWAEVYVKPYGWIPFDPSFADLKDAAFDKMLPIYIYMSHVRSDKELGNGHCFACWSEGDTIKASHSFKLIKESYSYQKD